MELICRECMHVGHPKKVKRGSGRMELIMWAVLLIPGPFYSVWRATGKKKQCAMCGSELLSRTDTAVGKRLMEIAENGTLPGRKPDAKVVDAVQQSINAVMRAETGTVAEKEKIPPQQVRGDSEMKQRPRGATEQQEPESW